MVIPGALTPAPFGPAALDALEAAVRAAQANDPLAPVTVVPPSNLAGLALRRLLARRLGGIVNVRFLVLARLAELLGGPRLAAQGSRPLSSTIRDQAIRAVLAQSSWPPNVRSSVSTERALRAAFEDLSHTDAAARRRLAAAGPRARQVVDLYERFLAGIADGGWYDEMALEAAAAAAVHEGAPGLNDIGHVILYLPRTGPAHRGGVASPLIPALAAAPGRFTRISGLTGDAAVDEALPAPPSAAATLAPPTATLLAEVADAEEEVRTAIRLLVERAASGTPFARMAILYRLADPYARLVHEQLTAAGLTHHGPAVTTLAETVPGRTLLGLLDLAGLGFRRDHLMALITSVPILEPRAPGGPPQLAPAQRWDVLSRSAGVVGAGPSDDWASRLGRFVAAAEQQIARLAEADDASPGRLSRLHDDIAHARRLHAFVDVLRTATRPPAQPGWAALSAWAHRLIEDWLGGPGRRQTWPQEEQDACDAVIRVVAELAALGTVEPSPSIDDFRRALESALEAPGPRLGPFGRGVFAGFLRTSRGLDFDTVFVLGMAEGQMPPRGQEDALMPDAERRLAAPALPLLAERRREEREDFLAALATARERVLLHAAGDLRQQRVSLPSRWLLESASALAGRSILARDYATLPPAPWLLRVPSFAAGIADAAVEASPQEHDLRSLGAAGGNVASHPLAVGSRLGLGLAAERARAEPALGPWTGATGPLPGIAPGQTRPAAPTALEQWARCPARYFYNHVLHIPETERPEAVLALSPLERGNLIHGVLETFFREMPPPLSTALGWPPEQRDRLRAIAEAAFAVAEAAGLAGRPLLWRLERARIRRELEAFLDWDSRQRRDTGLLFREAEFAFGRPEDDYSPVSLTLPDGRTVAFRGRIDRVDTTPGAGLVAVRDYKTGRVRSQGEVNKDPLEGGASLQLPIYALAARAAFGTPDTVLQANYIRIDERAAGEIQQIDVPVDDGLLARLSETVAVLTATAAEGLFPMRPGPPYFGGFKNCGFCPYDRLCPRSRARAWEAAQDDPRLAGYMALEAGGD